MSRFLKLMSILAIVALIAVPAFAEVQNVKVSGDIDSKMITRANYDFNNNLGSSQDKDTWFTSTARLQVDVDLTDNVSTCVRLLNERDWGKEDLSTTDNNSTEILLDIASVKMKEMFYAPLTMTIGRQNLRFGNGLVVGDPDSNDAAVNGATASDLSLRKSFDAVRATLDYNPLVVDLIFAKVDAGTVGVSKTGDDTNLSGINAAYKFDKYNSEMEAYMFSKNTRSTTLDTDNIYTYGVRGSLEPISKLVVDAELAMQKGDYVVSGEKLDRSAWAADLGAVYAIDYKWSPKVGARYSYRSGSKTGTSGANDDTGESKYKAWDTSFEDQTHGIIANKIFDGNNDGVDSNGSTINVMASVVPLQDLTVALDYYNFMLAQKWGTTVTTVRTLNSSGSYEIRDNKNLGQEVDLSLVYDYTEDVKLGLTAGYFLPGKAFLKDNNDPASTVMADVKVSF